MQMHANRPLSRPAPKALLLALAAIGLAILPGYRPFSPVTTVCPSCAEKGDKVTLAGEGKVLTVEVVAKNQDGYILSKYGELRFVQFPEIGKVDFASGAEPKGLDAYDQILIKNKEQTVLHGTIISVEAGKPLALRSPRGQVYMVSPAQVVVYYQRGQRKAPPAVPAALGPRDDIEYSARK